MTMDSSGKAGVRYKYTSGVLKFGVGVARQSIEIPILQDDKFDVTLEFLAVLSEPGNAQLGQHLDQCCIRVIDDDAFPDNKYRDFFHSKQGESLKADTLRDKLPHLMRAYFRMNLRNSVVRRGTWKYLAFSLMKNLFFISQLVLSVLLIESIQNKKKGQGSVDWLYPYHSSTSPALFGLQKLLLESWRLVTYDSSYKSVS
jgi:hypothetical protein